jgi:hypothetical protein
MLDQKMLQSIVSYDPDTGVMIWLPKNVVKHQDKRWNTIFAGKQVGRIESDGYLGTNIKVGNIQKSVKIHRLAWLYMFGHFPDGPLDHINRIKSDNRISNLRIANASLNGHNIESFSTNKSGVKGVSWCKLSKKWKAIFVFRGKHMHLGLYVDIENAKNAYALASYLHVKEFSIYSGNSPQGITKHGAPT